MLLLVLADMITEGFKVGVVTCGFFVEVCVMLSVLVEFFLKMAVVGVGGFTGFDTTREFWVFWRECLF